MRIPIPASTLLVTLLLVSPLSATHPLPGPHRVSCEAIGNAVRVQWDLLGIAPGSHAALLYRDADFLVSLAPDSLSYDDKDVSAGQHVYRLDVVRTDLRGEVGDVGGAVIASRSCEIEVLLESQIRCEVFGGIATPPEVSISWDPLPEDLPVLEIQIRRDGEAVASLPARASDYSEAPLHGEHVYTVVARLTIVEVAKPLPPNELVVGECTVNYVPPVIGGFVRGDCNGDEASDISDAVCILMHLFRGRPDPPCPKSADADDNGALEPADTLVLLHYLFLHGPAPAPPFPECGHDNTHDELPCDLFPSCFNPPPP